MCVEGDQPHVVSQQAGQGTGGSKEEGMDDGKMVGGFNVSNLMGITRRMIDIGKKITFYFLQNV